MSAFNGNFFNSNVVVNNIDGALGNNIKMSPFNGNFFDSKGEVRNLDGGLGNKLPMSPFNGNFFDSNGQIRNIDSLIGGGGGGTPKPITVTVTPEDTIENLNLRFITNSDVQITYNGQTRTIFNNRFLFELAIDEIITTPIILIGRFIQLEIFGSSTDIFMEIQIEGQSELKMLAAQGVSSLNLNNSDLSKVTFLSLYQILMSDLNFSKFPSLTELYLNFSKLKTFESNNVPKLLRIDLSNNPIETFDGSYLKNIEYISVQIAYPYLRTFIIPHKIKTLKEIHLQQSLNDHITWKYLIDNMVPSLPDRNGMSTGEIYMDSFDEEFQSRLEALNWTIA